MVVAVRIFLVDRKPLRWRCILTVIFFWLSKPSFLWAFYAECDGCPMPNSSKYSMPKSDKKTYKAKLS